MYKYDVALSYESKQENFVQEVADYIKSEGFEVFFAPERKKEILSENLKCTLYQVYQNESLLKVLFVTKEYLNSQYTMLEARRSLNSVQDNPRRLIVVNYVGNSLPSYLQSCVYLEKNLCADEIAFMVCSRVHELKKERKKPERQRAEDEMAAKNINIVTENKGIVAGNNIKISNIHFNK